MRLGVMMFPTDQAIAPDDLAREVEKRGFASLYVPEHTHIPVDHSPFPGGGDLPEMYKRTLDPFVALTAAATVTTDLRLGTGIALIPQHDPIDLAKKVASLDHLSGGRFDFGIGYGWNVPETENHGVRFSERRQYTHDAIGAMKALWADGENAYTSQHVTFEASYAYPKPVQRPHPPILLGAGFGPKAVAALVEHCDGWLPIGGRGGQLEETIPQVKQALEDAGRDPESFLIHVYGAKPEAEVMKRFAKMGAQQTSLWLPAAPREDVIPLLDRYAGLLEGLG